MWSLHVPILVGRTGQGAEREAHQKRVCVQHIMAFFDSGITDKRSSS